MYWKQALKAFRDKGFLQHSKHYPELVNRQRQNQLRSLASRATPAVYDINLEVHQMMLGERLSPFAKSGYEFAETRLYQVGDNVRFINWRRYANTGQLYINTFHEERRPQCWIVMDRRINMRFGTRVRLKVEQAANYAFYHLFKAQHHQLDIGGILLDQELQWFEAKSASANLNPLLQQVNAPAPPITDIANVQLNQVLRLLNVRLSPGCLIILISDFSDLTASDATYLSSLADKHTLAAVHIIDPIEAKLPDKGFYNIAQETTQSILPLNCNDPSLHQLIDNKLQERLQEIKGLLKQSGVQYKLAYSDEDFEDDNLVAST